MPDPLHPAVVHFPIVLLILGLLAALLAGVWPKGYFSWLTAALLVLAVVAAAVVVNTGDREAEMVGRLSDAAGKLIDEHKEWAERTLFVSIVAAVVSVIAAATPRWPRVQRGSGILAALLALVAVWFVFQTGHRGGQMVYRHGVGVQSTQPNPSAEGASEGAPPRLLSGENPPPQPAH